MNAPQKSAKASASKSPSHTGFTAEERAAMKQRAKELKAANTEADVLAKIAEMSETDRAMATRLHEIITENAPGIAPRLYYGMPAYAVDGKIVCFFQPAAKFKTRYSTLGFNDIAALDDGTMWPVAYALTTLTAADEARIGELVKQAVSR